MKKSTIGISLATLALASASSTAFAQSPRDPLAPPPPPMRVAPNPPPTAAPDMQAVLDQLAAMGAVSNSKLTPDAARLQPTPADAVKAVMKAQGQPIAPDPAVKTMDLPYAADAPEQFARVYRPVAAEGATGLPVVVYYHGGGWVIANVGVYDAAPRLLAKQLNAIVVSVEYRHAPEFKFPAQHDDAATAYRWVLANAQSWGGDPAKIALVGESAGGNLAVATAIYARDNGLTAPLSIVAVYPIANSSMTLPSRMDAANAKPLDTPSLAWFGYYYSTTPADQQDPRINLVAANLRGLPPTTIINAQIDPLRSDGETLAAAMRAAGVAVEQRTFPGVTHEFFGMGSVVRGAYDANGYAIGKLRTTFGIR